MLSAKLWFFNNLGAYSRLPDKVLEAIKDEGRVERWGHGAKIHHDPRVPEVYMILGGQVFIDDATPAKDLLLRRGDVFGGASQVDVLGDTGPEEGGPILRAVDETTLSALEPDVFRDLVGEHLGHFQTRTRRFGTSNLVEVPVMPLLGTTPASRLARVLVHLFEIQGQIDGDSGFLNGPLRTRALARLSGLDRTRIALLLDLFRGNDLLRFNGRTVMAPSIEALKGWALGNEEESR